MPRIEVPFLGEYGESWKRTSEFKRYLSRMYQKSQGSRGGVRWHEIEHMTADEAKDIYDGNEEKEVWH